MDKIILELDKKVDAIVENKDNLSKEEKAQLKEIATNLYNAVKEKQEVINLWN